MSLSIISNQAASIAARNLGQANEQATDSAEKLSTGKRVNSAADDAAASAIAARLSAEVAGLEQAGVNAGQGASLLQIADGAFQNTEDILTRAKSLAVQAGSDQLSDTERSFLDQEFQSLKSEIDRIANDTEFNSIKLVKGENAADVATDANTAFNVDGTLLNGMTTTGAMISQVGAITTTASGQRSLTGTVTANATNVDTAKGISGFNVDGLNLQADFTAAKTTGAGDTIELQSPAQVASLSFASASNTLSLMVNTMADNSTTLTGSIATAKVDGAMSVTTTTAFQLSNGDGATAQVTLASSFMTDADINTNNDVLLQAGGNKEFTFKVGTGVEESEDEVSVNVGAISTGALGIANESIDTKSAADSASVAVSEAIDTLQAKRSDVGAAQNRLDFAEQNVQLTRENQESARSELEDLNVAREITEFSQSQLLVQAGTSTLSQANNLPQNLLQLFQ